MSGQRSPNCSATCPARAWHIKDQTWADDVLLLEWAADATRSRADGVDTFVFRDLQIRVQTVHYTLQRKS